MRLLLIGALILVATSSDAAEKYLCKDFAKDFGALIDSEVGKIDVSPQLLRASGLMMGTYYAHEGDPLEEDSSGLRTYENRVFDECKKHPSQSLSLVALDVIRESRRLGEAFTATSTSPAAQIVNGRIEYQSNFNTTRIIYGIRNATDRLIGVSVQCSLYDKDHQPLGQSGGWTNDIPAKGTVVGEGMARTSDTPARTDCRIVKVTNQ